MSDSSRWISNNLSLTGMDAERSVFMVFKELVENSLDALRGNPGGRLLVTVESLHDCLEITCSDTGTGFDAQAVSAIHKLFESHRKKGTGHVSSGKFGVGLKALALLCSKECVGREVSIQTVVGFDSQSPHRVSFKIAPDDSGIVSIREPQIDIFDSQTVDQMRTVVTAYAPYRPNSMDSLASDIVAYFAALSLASSSISLDLVIDTKPVPVKPISPMSEIQLFDPSGILHCFVSIERTASTNNPTISILRYVNGAPLITPGSSTNNCVLVSGVLSALLKFCPSLGVEVSTVNPHIDSIISWTLPILSRPQGSSWDKLTIGVALTCSSADVQYPSLCKSAVVGVGSSSSVEKLVTRCITNGLKKIQKRIPSQFQSPEDHEYKRAINEYIPIIAHNLAQVMRRSSTIDANCELSQLLRITAPGGPDDYETLIIKNLSDALGGPPRSRKSARYLQHVFRFLFPFFL